MITTQHLKNHFEINTRLIRRALDGLTQEDTLAQAPYSVNCINWTLGHILQGREQVLQLLGAPPQLTQEETVRYRSGSQPIGADSDALGLERVQTVLSNGLADWVFFFYFHDSDHTGELAVLRQLCGKPAKIV